MKNKYLMAFSKAGIFSLLLTLSICAHAQGGLYNNGANIVVTDASTIYIDGSAINTGNYTSASSGLIKNSGALGTCTVKLTGNWINNSSTAGIVNNTGSTVTFLGTAVQRIGGTGTTTAFYNVNFEGGSVKTFTIGETGATISNFAIVDSDGSTVVANGKMTLTSTATTNGNLFGPAAGNYISKDVIVQSYYTGGAGSRRYKFASSPTNETVTNLLTGNMKSFEQIKQKILVTTATGASGFDAGATTNTIQIYDETLPPNQYSYWGITSLTATLDPGVGFVVFYRGDRTNPVSIINPLPEPVTIAYQGTVNQGPITVSNLKFSDYSGYIYPSSSFIRSDGLNLVGNPYPCTIDFSQIAGADRPNINNTVYVGNILTSGFSGIVMGAIYNGGSTRIQPGQSFFVQATANTSITFRESSKYSGNLQPMRLLSSPGSGKINTISSGNSLAKLIRINLQDALKIDETLITFKEGNKSTYNVKEDASYMGGSSVSLSTIANDGTQLLYNALPPVKLVDTIKLNVSASATKNVKLNFTDLEAAGYYQVFLKDNLLKQIVDVKLSPTYAFDINRADAKTFGSERFVLLFKKPIPIELTSFTAKDNNGAELKWKTRHEEFNDYFEVERSIDGVNFYKLETVDGVNRAKGSSEYTFSDKDPLNGVNYYRLKQVDMEGNVTYTDTISLSYTFNNLANGKEGNIIVYPNPAIQLINVDIPNRGIKVLRIGIIDLHGKRVKTSTVGKSQKIQEDVSNLIQGIYIVEVTDASTNELIGRAKFVKVQ